MYILVVHDHCYGCCLNVCVLLAETSTYLTTFKAVVDEAYLPYAGAIHRQQSEPRKLSLQYQRRVAWMQLDFRLSEHIQKMFAVDSSDDHHCKFINR